MRILMVIESLRDGGKQRRLVELLRVMSTRKQHRIMVLFLKDSVHYKEIYEMDGIEFLFLKRRFRADPGIFWSFLRKAREFKPDLIHSWGGLPSLISLPYILLFRKPFVNGMIANSRLRFLSPAWFRVKCTFPFSDAIIANSEIGLKVYKVPENKGRLIRNGINFDRKGIDVSKESLKKRYELNGAVKVVGMVATIDWRKNFPMFIKSALCLLRKRNDVVFFIVGDGPDRPKIMSMIPQEQKSHFVFTGKIRNVEDVVSFFDVGVLASFGEGTSNSLLEYMLFDKPVVATDVLGINEVVENGITGYLVRQDDFEDMAQKINDLLNNEDLASKMGAAGHELVGSRYSIEKMVAGYEKIYDDFAGN
jgi:glycosyltransferase involved in cell wall biosynthesis